jgi:hypothetical protein
MQQEETKLTKIIGKPKGNKQFDRINKNQNIKDRPAVYKIM